MSNLYIKEGQNKNLEKSFEYLKSFSAFSARLKLDSEKSHRKLTEKFSCSQKQEDSLKELLDAGIFKEYKQKNSISELNNFITKYSESKFLLDASDYVDELRVKKVIQSGEASRLEQFTKLEAFNTNPIDVERKRKLFANYSQEVINKLEEALIKNVRQTKSYEDYNQFKNKFPNSSALTSLQKDIIDEKVRQIKEKEINNEVDRSVSNEGSDFFPTKKIISTAEGKFLSFVIAVSDTMKYTETKYYFDETQKIIFIETIVSPFFYELPKARAAVKSENKKIY